MKKLLLSLVPVAALIFAGKADANTCSVRQAGSTDQTVYVTFLDATTGVPNAGLAFNSSGIDLEYVRTAATAVDITEVTQTTNGAHSDGGFVSVGHGRYRLDLPDAAVAAGVPEVVIQGTITGYIMAPCTVALSPPVNVVSTGTDAITATSIAADAIGSSEIATDAIGAAELAANSITSSEIADDSIDAGAIATDAITATEVAADAIGASEIASNAIAAAEIADGAIDEATFATTAGSFKPLGIVDQGTAQAATGTTLQLRSAAAFADSELVGSNILITGGSAGVGQVRTITGYVSSTDTATVATWTTTPTGTITYVVLASPPGAGGSVTIGAGGISASSFAAGAIDANAIATDAIGAAELASGAIDAATFASGAIDATAIAADAIGSSELAADAITSSEIATDAIGAAELAANSITSSEVADDSIDAGAIATDAIGASEIASNAIAAAEVADGAIDDATFATTAGAFNSLGIVDQGTAQAATSTTLQLRSAAAFADDEIIGATCMITGGSAGVGQARAITDYVSSTDTATVATWTTTPTGTITYKCFGTAAASGGGGGGLDAAGVRAALGMSSANLDSQLSAIDDYVDTEVAAILDDTGTSGVVIVNDGITAAKIATDAIGASEIAADAIGSSEIATDAIGASELAASAIGSSEIADGGITSTEFGTGAITATVIAADAIGASELAADAIGSAELAADAIGSSEVADGAIDAGALATDAITAAKIAADAITSSEIAATAASEISDQTWEEAIGDHSATVGSAAEALAAAGGGGATDQELGILRQGTAQSATSTTLVMDTGAAFGDDTAIGMTLIACGSTQGYCQARTVTDSVLSTDTLTVNAWTVTPSGTITFYLFGTAPGSSGGLDAAAVRAALGMASANLDTQLTAIDDAVDTEVSAIKAKTDQLNFSVTGEVDANTKSMNDEAVCGTGDSGNAWKGCP